MNEPMNTEPNKPSATLERERDILRAEVEDLKRERDEERLLNEVLQANLKDIRQGQDKEQNVCVDLMRERDEANAENDRLRAAIQRAEDTEKQLLEVAQIVHENSHPQQLRARLFNLLMRHMPDGPNATAQTPPDFGTKDHE